MVKKTMAATNVKNKKNYMPNFLIIGAMKSGTTSLHNYLNQHPDVFMSPRKEPHFFSYENYPIQKYKESMDKSLRPCGETTGRNRIKYAFPITQLNDYQKLFKNARSAIAIGESSVSYLYLPRSTERIHHHIPHVKLIAILRNPVDRAYSHFIFRRKNGREAISDFATALQMEPERIRQDWAPGCFYMRLGFYHEQLARYYNRFDRSQIKVCLFEDFSTNPANVVQDIFRFLGVDTDFVPDTTKKYNVFNDIVFRPKLSLFNYLFNRPNLIKSMVKYFIPDNALQKVKLSMAKHHMVGSQIIQYPPLPGTLRKQLQKKFRDDILKLQDLINQDLSGWLT